MTRVVVFRNRRFLRAQRSQALQHVVIGLGLLLTGLAGLGAPEMSRLLAGYQILSGALLFVAAASEVRGKHQGHGTAISVVDLLAGFAALAEGFHLVHRGSHRIQYVYFAVAAVWILRAVLHRWLVSRRRLELDPHGFLLCQSLFRSIRGRWTDLRIVRDSPELIEFTLDGGPGKAFNLSVLDNAAEARAAFLGYPESRIALVREVGPLIGACELTYLERVPIDLERARSQHDAYVELLASLGCTIRWLPPASDLPDAVFVEDAAIVLDELAIVTRPGAASRRVETGTVEPVLREYRPVRTIAAPATLDGGDVIVAGRRIYIGLSTRSTRAAVDQVRRWVEPAGYRVYAVPLRGCLHLKSAATPVGDDLVLVNPERVNGADLPGVKWIEVDPAEPEAANALRLGPAVILPASCPATRGRLEAAGIRVHGIDLSELAKAEGAITCCSLVFRAVAVATPEPLPA